jgi:hypothetical protein
MMRGVPRPRIFRILGRLRRILDGTACLSLATVPWNPSPYPSRNLIFSGPMPLR